VRGCRKVAVQAFTSVGWPARLITTSATPHLEHSLVEAWSNRFSKWFMVDTDFNIVFEPMASRFPPTRCAMPGRPCRSRGAPPEAVGRAQAQSSAYRAASVFAYVHVDMRSDWHTRKLRWAAPREGISQPGGPPAPISGWHLAEVRVDDPGRFDWPVNFAWMPSNRSAAMRPDTACGAGCSAIPHTGADWKRPSMAEPGRLMRSLPSKSGCLPAP